MASDEIVWDIINNQFCSYKIKTAKEQSFCRNEYNVSGYCSKQHCPLANSRYATVRSDPSTGRLYLYMKTIERAHTPNRWWERVRLPADYNKALDMIDERLVYWPKFLLHKCKQRLTRLTQVAIRTKRLQKEELRLGERIVPKLAPKVRSREATRERKAEAAAKVERAIERELIDRLKSGAYGDRPLNVEEGIWKKVLRGLEQSEEGVRDNNVQDVVDSVDYEHEEEHEYDMDGDQFEVEYVSEDEESELESADADDFEDWLGGGADDEVSSHEEYHSDRDNDTKRKRLSKFEPRTRKRTQKEPKRMIEYEMEKAEIELPQLVEA